MSTWDGAKVVGISQDVTLKLNSAGAKVEAVEDSLDASNKVLEYTKLSKGNDFIKFALPSSKEGEAVEVTFDMLVKEVTAAGKLSISLMNVDDIAYQSRIALSTDGTVQYGDRLQANHSPQGEEFYKTEADAFNKWHTIKIVYTPTSATENVQLYVDGELLVSSDRSYRENASGKLLDEGIRQQCVSGFQVAGVSTLNGVLCIDNIKIKTGVKVTFDNGMPEDVTLKLPGGKVEAVEDPLDPSNKVME